MSDNTTDTYITRRHFQAAVGIVGLIFTASQAYPAILNELRVRTREQEAQDIENARIWLFDTLNLEYSSTTNKGMTTILANTDPTSIVGPLNPTVDMSKTLSRNANFMSDIQEIVRRASTDGTRQFREEHRGLKEFCDQVADGEFPSLLVTGSDRRSSFVRVTTGHTLHSREDKFVHPNGRWCANLNFLQWSDANRVITRHDSPTGGTEPWNTNYRTIVLRGNESQKFCADDHLHDPTFFLRPHAHFLIRVIRSPLEDGVNARHQVVYVSGVHGLGAVALRTLFHFPLKKIQLTFIEELRKRIRSPDINGYSINGWEVLGRAEFTRDRHHHHKLTCESLDIEGCYPITSKYVSS